MFATRPALALAAALLAQQVALAAGWGTPSWLQNCCGSPLGGTCEDGTVGDPCCGKGGCNSACCGCDGGCRKHEAVSAKEITEEMKGLPLKKWPMIMTHDAGTGYNKDDTCHMATPVNNWAVTQPQGGFGRQLECGARAFDLRPYLKGDGRLVMHHGAVVFDTPVSRALEDIIKWSQVHEATFVLVVAGHCDGEDSGLKKKCVSAAHDAITKDAKIPELACRDIPHITLGDAMKRGQNHDGGSVLMTWSHCVHFNWPEHVQCSGAALKAVQGKWALDPGLESVLRVTPHNGSIIEGDPAAPPASGNAGRRLRLDDTRSSMTCYGSQDDRKAAFMPLWKYMDHVTSTSWSYLWVAQAHWQYDTDAIVEGTARHSCILWDSSKSVINKLVMEKVERGHFKNINLLEVDNVCEHGHELFKALRGWVEDNLGAQEKYEEVEGPLEADGRAPGHSPAKLFALKLSATTVVGGFVAAATLAASLVVRRWRRWGGGGAAEDASYLGLVAEVDGSQMRDT